MSRDGLHGVQQRKRKHAAAAQATSNHTDSTRGRRGEEEGSDKLRKSRVREEREKGRKGQWERDQEGRGELVEKDVTGWTEVTRNKRKKMVQIFVKADLE